MREVATSAPPTITQQFAESVARYGARTALIDGAVHMSYAALDRAANLVAHAIAASRTAAAEAHDAPIVILLGHDVVQIAAILGVLKTGRAYCALDPTFPPERSAAMLAALQCRLIVTDAAHRRQAQNLAQERCAVLDLDAVAGDLPHAFRSASIAPDGAAAIFFTSGSTGAPKGIIRTHCNLIDLALARAVVEPCRADDVVSMLYSASFSAASSDLYGALLTGATLCLYDLRSLGVAGMATWLATYGVTRLHIHAPVLRQLLDNLPETTVFPALRYVRPSDRLYTADVARLWRHLPQEAVIAHLLGASESGVIAAHKLRRGMTLAGEIVPVGKLLPGVELRLLDEHGVPVAPGETGEIVVSTPTLTPGYWRDPALTAAKFFYDPASKRRFYRQGDLARWRPDGLLELAGRTDFQVKIRGFRVELGEVEAALEQLPAVRQALVVADAVAADDPRLVAYLAPAPPGAFTLAAVRRDLAARLPPYMVPAAYIVMETLPLMSNGKVDRQALPSPATAQPAVDTPYIAPRTPLEHQVAIIWADVLALTQVGIHDNFLDLGGHSLQAARIVSRIAAACQVDLPLSVLFDAPTVAAMTLAITQHKTTQLAAQEVEQLLAALENDVGQLELERNNGTP